MKSQIDRKENFVEMTRDSFRFDYPCIISIELQMHIQKVRLLKRAHHFLPPSFGLIPLKQSLYSMKP